MVPVLSVDSDLASVIARLQCICFALLETPLSEIGIGSRTILNLFPGVLGTLCHRAFQRDICLVYLLQGRVNGPYSLYHRKTHHILLF